MNGHLESVISRDSNTLSRKLVLIKLGEDGMSYHTSGDFPSLVWRGTSFGDVSCGDLTTWEVGRTPYSIIKISSDDLVPSNQHISLNNWNRCRSSTIREFCFDCFSQITGTKDGLEASNSTRLHGRNITLSSIRVEGEGFTFSGEGSKGNDNDVMAIHVIL